MANGIAVFRPPEMMQVHRKFARVNVKWRVLTGKASLVRRVFQFLWEKLICCSAVAAAAASTKPQPYRRLESSPSTSIRLGVGGGGGDCELEEAAAMMDAELATTAEHDKVVLKISLLGDCQIGKTSFVIKYVGDSEDERRCVQMTGVNLMDKILLVKGAKIAFSIWDVGGDQQFTDQVALACKDAAAILIMFDLTSRCTLNSVIRWYQEARKWNQTAIPILIGTKFDDFILLPLDVQWTIVNQARTYAHAMKATLFFSSAKHNINVNKIFKFITAKCFNLPWTIERNLTIGEPIIDF